MKQSGILVAANYLGSRLQADPEVQPPQRPRLPPEIIVLPFGREGLLFEGGKRTQVLTGTSSRTLLPAVLEQLDGTKTCDDIAAAIPYASVSDIKNIIVLLFSCGLLEDGLSPLPAEDFRELDAFLGRFVDVTRNNRNRGEAMARLREACIAIVGSPQVTGAIANHLAESGARSQVLGDGSLENVAEGQFLIAVATREGEDLGPLLAAAHKRAAKVLNVRIGEREAQIGPLFIPGRTACYECTRALYALPEGDANPTLLPMWLSLASLQIVHLVARTADVRLFGGFESYEQTSLSFVHRFRYVARLPGCHRCGIIAPELRQQSGEMLAWLYHNSVAMPPHELGSRKVFQQHYLAQNIVETQRPAEAYHGARVTSLPQVIPSNGTLTEGGPMERGVGLRSLATLLKCSVGYQDIEQEGLRRIAPTGGGMGSPEFFVIAHAVEGLPRGIYHYHAPRHVLEWLRDVVPEDTTAALGVTHWDQPCTVIGTGALQKLRSKYEDFAYRIVNLDAGISLYILNEIAAILGIPTRLQHNIHDEGVARLVGLPRKDNRYVVTFALGLGSSIVSPPPAFKNLGLRILDAVISESTLPNPSEQVARIEEENEETWGRLNVLFTHLLNRRTVREYEEWPLSRKAVLAMAKAATYWDRRYQADAQVSASLHQWWLVRIGSPQLEAGVYEFESTSGRLVLRGPNLSENEVRQCLNQTALAAAPTILFLTADLGTRLRSRGARGYREVLLQCGNACGSVLISAESLNLGACPTAGIMEHGFRQLTACDGYNECPIIAITLGHH